MVEISANPNASGNNVLGTRLYAVNESIYTEVEIGAANFTSATTAIDQVSYNISTVGINTTFTNVTIWMKEVALSATELGTGTYTTAGYTQVFAGSVTVAAPGWTAIPLTVPFQRTAGTNLQVLIERQDGVAHTGYVYRSANGNQTGATAVTSRRYNDATPLSPTTSLTAIAVRAQIRLQHVQQNDALVQEIYSLGKLPVPFGTPHVIRANIANVGAGAFTNLPVTLSITGANTFSDVKTIPSLAAGASIEVSFNAFSPLAQGNNAISVSVPADDYNSNNVKTVVQAVNNNTFSYSYGTVPLSAVGFNASTGDFAVRFNTSVATAISQVSVNFIAGGQPFQVGIWDAAGTGGTPGQLLFSSTIQTSTSGVYVLPVLPAVPIAAGDFFVGVQQTGTANVSFAYQNEDPIRLNTFYLTQPSGGTTWTDLAPANRFRFMIEPKLQLPIDANVTKIVTPAALCSNGPVSYGAVISNVGSNVINSGAATVTLKIGGANTFNGTLSNSTNIPAGGSETIFFNAVDIMNAGTNTDTAFVTLTGDTEQANDTLFTSDISAVQAPVTVFPATENGEAALPLFPYFKIVFGSNSLWRVQTGNYSNAVQTTPLAPHSGTKFFLCDNFSGGNSTGYVSRLSSNCISLPGAAGNSCGYEITWWMSHDNTPTITGADSLYLSVSTNNGLSWTRLLPGYLRNNGAFSSPGWERLRKDLSAYAGQTIQIGFEGVSKHGNAFGLDDISISSIPVQELSLATATSNGVILASTCDDLGWTYYANPATPTVPVFAINWDPSASGANVAAKGAAVATIQLDPALFAAEDIPGKMATYTMRRYWNVSTASTALTAPVNVRFFYDPAEKTAVDDAASSFATANAGIPETATWFKTVATNFAGDVVHVTPDGVVNAIPLNDVNSAGATINGILYAEFDGVAGFSGGTYAAGVGPNTPLPVSLLSFDAKRSGKLNSISWSTTLELNTSRFIVERSLDGRAFTSLGEVKAAGNTTGLHKYSFTDNNPPRGINYYRLRVVDVDNSGRYSPVRSVRNEGAADIAIYPNPVKGSLNLKINADMAGRAAVLITDISGKTILSKNLPVAAGMNQVPINVENLAAGAYVMKITLGDEVIMRKFDKQ
jgi:hypothetical protein